MKVLVWDESLRIPDSYHENRPLVAELKFKMSQNGRFFMFLISSLPPEGGFQMSVHF